jgi:hypothetical protein
MANVLLLCLICFLCRAAVALQVCALLIGGGYAQEGGGAGGPAVAGAEGVSLTDTAGLPELACSVWSTVFMTSHLSPANRSL